MNNIRNFCIIAHIDHGKSTLADRLLEFTGTIAPRQMEDQVLDRMDLERERGITIKAKAVRLAYRARNGAETIFNLIDTPGHVDFSYEVSRSLSACEGALIVVDASQGVEAQTLANAHLAARHKLVLIPVINKIDLPNADVPKTLQQVEDLLALDRSEAILASAKQGIGTEEILEAVVQRIPPPQGDADGPLRALVVDSWYDPYVGVIVYVRLVDGRVRPGTRILFCASGGTFEVTQVGVFTPRMQPVEELRAGEVGYLAAGIRDVAQSQVGDTITEAERPAARPLPGFQRVRPMVFAGLYPTDTSGYLALKEALEKLRLNDAALSFEPETSVALGFGFRCGFLGLLHMEIIQERLEREFALSLLTTAPTVVYRVTCSDGTVVEVDNPAKLPPPQSRRAIEEPHVRASLFTPQEYLGALLQLCQ